jgi:hypothetical protein
MRLFDILKSDHQYDSWALFNENASIESFIEGVIHSG